MRIKPRVLRSVAGIVIRLAVLLCVIGVNVAAAVCPVEEWSSPNANVASERIASLARDEDSVDGIGGSGILPGGDDEDGIGGSGIYGTVTGFGSLCVNGQRIAYDDSLRLTIDGMESVLSTLAVGHVVRAETLRRGGQIFATSIEIQHDLVGPVTAISLADGLVEVMGEALVLDSDLAAELQELDEDIGLGTRIAVSGLRTLDDDLVVSRIDIALQSDLGPDLDLSRSAGFVSGLDLVRGVARRDERGNSKIAGLRLIEAGAESRIDSAGAGAGERLVVRGRWNPKAHGLDVTGIDRSAITAPRDQRMSLEGYVTTSDEKNFRVAGQLFQKESKTQGVAIRVGDRIRVQGFRQGDEGSMRVTSVVRVPEERFLQSLSRKIRAARSIRRPLDQPDDGDQADRPHRPRISEQLDQGHRPDRLEPSRRPDRPDVPRPHRPPPRRDSVLPRTVRGTM